MLGAIVGRDRRNRKGAGHWLRHTAYLLWGLVLVPALTVIPASASTSLQTGIPEEFLDLVGPGEGGPAQGGATGTGADGELFVDFYVDNIRRGDILVAVKEDVLSFHDPSRVADLIEDLRGREDFIERLSAGFALDGKTACAASRSNPCIPPRLGRFGILIDADDLRLDLFRSDRYKTPPPPLVPSHPDQLGLVAGLTGRVSGSHDGRTTNSNASLSYDVVTGVGPNSLFATGFADQDGEVSIYQAGAQSFRGRYRIAGGILISETSEFFSQQDLLGAEVHTTALTEDISVGTEDAPILVFLARPSYIDVFRDGQLLHSTYADAGPYRVPTSNFPSGSYDVQVQIKEDSGETRVEDRFFARVSSVRRRDYALQAGITRERGGGNRFGASDDGLLYVAARVSQPVGLTEVLSARLGLLDQTGFLEASATGTLDGLIWRASALGTSEGGFGVAAQVSGTKYGVNVTARGRYSDIDESKHAFRRSALGKNAEATLNASAPVPLIGGYISSFGRYISRSKSSTNTSYGLTWTRPIALFDRGTSVQLTLGLQDTGRDKRFDARLRVARTQGRSTLSGTLGMRHIRSDTRREEEYTQRARWIQRSDPKASSPWSFGVRASNSRSDPMLGVSGSIVTPRVMADARVDHSFNNPGRTNYFATASTSIAASPHGIDLVGHRDAEAGVFVDLREEDAEPDIQLNVDGRAKEIERRLSFVPLNQFKPHALRIRPKSGGALGYNAGVLNVTAFPGNVVRLKPRFLRLVSLFGRIVDETGEALPGANLKFGPVAYKADEGGYFIVDAPAALSQIEGTTPNGGCAMDLPDLVQSQEAAFLDLGDIVCGTVRDHSTD